MGHANAGSHAARHHQEMDQRRCASRPAWPQAARSRRDPHRADPAPPGGQATGTHQRIWHGPQRPPVRNERGDILGSTTYSRVWEEARQFAFTPAQAASPLAGRPYDLRHAALTTWLNAGIGPAEVSKRAGNTVEVLLRRYAGCLDNQAESINRRIEQPSSSPRSSPRPDLELGR